MTWPGPKVGLARTKSWPGQDQKLTWPGPKFDLARIKNCPDEDQKLPRRGPSPENTPFLSNFNCKLVRNAGQKPKIRLSKIQDLEFARPGQGFCPTKQKNGPTRGPKFDLVRTKSWPGQDQNLAWRGPKMFPPTILSQIPSFGTRMARPDGKSHFRFPSTKSSMARTKEK